MWLCDTLKQVIYPVSVLISDLGRDASGWCYIAASPATHTRQHACPAGGGPDTNSIYRSYTSQGCYKDDPAGQRRIPKLLNKLANGAPASGDLTSTIEKCASLAAAAGYTVFAVRACIVCI